MDVSGRITYCPGRELIVKQNPLWYGQVIGNKSFRMRKFLWFPYVWKVLADVGQKLGGLELFDFMAMRDRGRIIIGGVVMFSRDIMTQIHT